MRKKIAFISEHQSPLTVLGGIEGGGQVVYVDKLSKELTKHHFDVDIYTRWDDERLPEVIDWHNGVRVIHVKAGPIKRVPKEELIPYMDEFTDNMLKFMQKENLDYELIHAHFFMSGLMAANIKKLLGIPFVITFHALGKIRRLYQKERDCFPDERFAIEEKVVREADQIIAECPQDKEDLISLYHANQDVITIIPCGYDPNEFYPIDKRLARMRLNIPENKKILLQIGRIVDRKGIDTVILSLKYLVKKHIPVHLVIVGGETDNPEVEKTVEIEKLKEIAKKAGVLKYVTFVGRRNRDQLKYYYNIADVFVSTPWYEPFGITPLEAMGCGIPVIGSRVGGIQFSVVDGKTGYLVPAKDPKALAEKAETLFTDEKKALYFRENAIQRVNTFFTWEIIGQSVAALYEKVMYASLESTQETESQLQVVDTNFMQLIETAKKSNELFRILLIETARIIAKTLMSDKKVLVCGNGGSAMDSQHFATELVGHFKMENRKPLPIISLTSDSAIITSIGNDFCFEEVFSRQVEALGQVDDIFCCISTSGKSKNILYALEAAKRKGMICIGLLGKDGGKAAEMCDIAIIVPSKNTQTIQELHTSMIHTICEIVERKLSVHVKPEQTTRMVGVKYGKAVRKKKVVKKGEKYDEFTK